MTDDEKWLRDELEAAVPPPPSTTGRAAAARARARRARRRTTALGAGGVAATVGVVAVLAAALSGGSGEPSPVDATDRGTPTSPYDVSPCPPGPRLGEDDPLDLPAGSGPDAVPDGALSVRLCQGAGHPIDVPSDALISAVDAMAAAVNGLGPLESGVCTDDLGPGYRLVFGYADGSTFVASGKLYGCGELVVGTSLRQDSRAALDRFGELLHQQRAGLDPPDDAPAAAIDCSRFAATGLTGAPDDLAVAVLCIERVAGGQQTRRAEISDDELTVLLADLARNTQEGGPYLDCAEQPPFPRIVGLTRWGDRVEIPSDCGIGWFLIGDRTPAVWRPGSEARMLLGRLVAEAR